MSDEKIHTEQEEQKTEESQDTKETAKGSSLFQEGSLDIPDTLPLLPVRDITIFNYMILPLFVVGKKVFKLWMQL